MRFAFKHETEPSNGADAVCDDSICGALVQVARNKAETVETALAAMPGVEIHLRPDPGRFVITVERAADTPAYQTLSEISRIAGVIDTSLVYHHANRDSQGHGEVLP